MVQWPWFFYYFHVHQNASHKLHLCPFLCLGCWYQWLISGCLQLQEMANNAAKYAQFWIRRAKQASWQGKTRRRIYFVSVALYWWCVSNDIASLSKGTINLKIVSNQVMLSNYSRKYERSVNRYAYRQVHGDFVWKVIMGPFFFFLWMFGKIWCFIAYSDIKLKCYEIVKLKMALKKKGHLCLILIFILVDFI